MKMQNLDSNETLGTKCKDVICAKFDLKLWFESDWYICYIAESGWFWYKLSRNTVPSNHFLKSVWKVTVQKSIVKLWIFVSMQMIKCQLSNAPFDQINDHKHHIYLCGKLSTKLLGQAADKNSSFMFMKIRQLLVLKYGFKSQKELPEVFCKKGVLIEISQNSPENTCVRASFLIKLQTKAYKFI